MKSGSNIDPAEASYTTERSGIAPPLATDTHTPSPTSTVIDAGEVTTSALASPDKILSAGCSYGPTLHITTKPHYNISPTPSDGAEPTPILWVDFPHHSTDDPFYFSKHRKWAILAVAFFFAHMTSEQVSVFAIGAGSMMRDIPGMTDFDVAMGTSAYGWVSITDRDEGCY